MILGRGSKVCVTGANGFIALHLVEQLLQTGVSVTAAVRSSDSRKLAPLLAMKDKGELNVVSGCDLLEPGSFEEAVKDARVSACLNAASCTAGTDSVFLAGVLPHCQSFLDG